MIVLMLSPSRGIVNVFLARVGIEPIYFLIKPEWFRTIYISSDIWAGFGWGAIIYLAQLSRVDAEVYEAATIDGAGRLRKIWHVSIPCLKPVISILLILAMGGLLSAGGQKVILLYNPNTYETADVIGSYVFRRGLVQGDFSYGAAVGLFGAVISLILVTIANSVAKKVSEFTVW